VDAGTVAAAYHDQNVRSLQSKRLQCDEIWSFCYAKQRNVTGAKAAPDGAGDVWTWTALDADSKLMVSWHVGDRTVEDAVWLLEDVQARIKNRIQLTTDGLGSYPPAVAQVFGLDIDFAQLVKVYRTEHGVSPERRPPVCVGSLRLAVGGTAQRGSYQHKLCGPPKPEYEDGNAPFYEPRPFAGAIFSLLQLCTHPQDLENVAGDGGWDDQ
jgi:hypothetical protein